MTDQKTLSGKKVLIVEDDTFLHTLLADKLAHLREQGVEIFTALNAEEALKIARESTPDLMMLDVAMPGKNGFEVIEELREDERFKKTPIIILSNISQESDEKRAQDLGVDAYLVKADFSLDEITNEITKLILR